MQGPNVIPIDVGVVPRPSTARILIAQAAWPADQWEKRDGLYFHANKERAEAFIQRVLAQARQHVVNLVVLPELSIPEHLLQSIQEFSHKSGAIVVAGSHYHRRQGYGYISRCPVIIDGSIHFTEKIIPAPIETSAIAGKKLQPGTTLHMFRNTSVGNFGVLICSDYLDDPTKRLLPLEEIDVLCVPAFQERSRTYHVRMGVDCESNLAGIYIAYANTLTPDHGDGRSAFFAFMDRQYLTELKDDGYTDGDPPWKFCELGPDKRFMVVDVDLKQKRPPLGKTVRSRANVTLMHVAGESDARGAAFANAIGHSDDRYIRIEELFVPPKEYPALLEKLEAHKIVFIVGDPGLGKTYTAARLLKEYYDRGFEPIWYAGLERQERRNQRQILDSFRPGKKQIVFFEDPFGRTDYEQRDTLPRIFEPLLDHLKDIDARVVITSRRAVFDQFREQARDTDFDGLTEDMSVVKPSYSVQALIEIAEKLASNALWYEAETCRSLVRQNIENGHLATPFAIRDFVFSTENVASADELRGRLTKRRVEQQRLFSEEIVASHARTKLALSAVFLYGSQPLAVLDEWFRHVAGYVDPSQSRSLTFTEEIRNQLGYRIEQYGTLATVLRFIHPLYEEAFVNACTKDAVTYDVVCSLLKLVTRTKIGTAVAGVTRHCSKYPELSRRLLEDVAPIVRADADLEELSQLGLRLLALERSTADEHFRHLLAEFCSLDELALRVSREKDLNGLALGFRYLYNYGRRMSTRRGKSARDKIVRRLDSLKGKGKWKERISRKLDWKTIFEVWSGAPNVSKVLEAIEYANLLAPAMVKEFTDSIDKTDFLSKFRLLSPPEQDRLRDVIKSWAPMAADTERFQNAPRTSRDRARLWLTHPDRLTRALIVDRGAVTAVKNGYSLLPVGIVSVIGDFHRGDAVSVLTEDQQLLGAGITAYGSEEIRAIRGRHSSLIGDQLRDEHGRAIIQATKLVRNLDEEGAAAAG